MNKILIADSGATKTDWALADDNELIERAATQGINPFHQEADAVTKILEEELRPKLHEEPDTIYFYGAGCTPEKSKTMKLLLEHTFTGARVEVRSDLWGAARALCGRSAGIACILGTGTNSCLYDGVDIVRNTPPLGYILGDEGSGAAMGKLFVSDILKGLMPCDVTKDFFSETGATKDDIIDHVYRQRLPGRYLASFSFFIEAHREHESVHEFLLNHFRSFFVRNVKAYNRPDLPVNFIGSIAKAFRTELETSAVAEGFTIGKIEKSPLPGLLEYHV